MFKKFGFLIVFFLGIALLITFSNTIEEEDVKGEQKIPKLVLGYCETFERYALDFAKENNLEIKKLANSAKVLGNLKFGEIDYAIIGRRAYSYEIDNQTKEIPLEDFGLTLISKEKDFIEYSDLYDFEIHTYLEENKVRDFLPGHEKILFYESIEEVLSAEIVLISWEDFRDGLELLVPIVSGSKVEKFRTPILYTKR